MQTPASDPSAADDLDTIARAIGLIVLQWGQSEQAMDLLVAMLWQSFGGKGYAKRIPIMLEPKINFLRACISQEPLLATEVGVANELLERFEALSSLRHDLIHGAVASISPVDNAFIFAKLDVKDGFHYHREVRIEAEEYPRIIDKLVALGRDSNALNRRVFEVMKIHKPRIL